MPFSQAELILLQSTESTNQFVLNLIKTRPLGEGSIVYTQSQTQGKGQGNNRWESEPGKNLTATIVLYPDFLKPEHQFMLTKVVSMSVCSLLDNYSLPARAMIKWPNDIYVNHNKIAGILINNEISGNTISMTIAGLGLNINQESFSKNAPGAISLKMLTGNEFDLNMILTEWHSNMEQWYKKLMDADFNSLDAAYLERLYCLNQPAEYIIRGEKMEATILGLAEYGMLLLNDNNGRQFKCGLQEVVFVR
ncbi:MAG: biotin--[acetyl-CoA-carboxylase] ligase [Bacteroidales bacterium]|nr:biotin--[acetyl-CoA-carboxylase] ligase [Bacteroidales bacterium]